MPHEPRPLSFLRVVLWTCFVISAAGSVFMIVLERDERTTRQRVAEFTSRQPTLSSERHDLAWEVGWKVNPYGGYPTCFVLSTGFLALMYTLEALRKRPPTPAPDAQSAPEATIMTPPPARQGAARKPAGA
jgi:hypothetical protein